jgi:transposase
MAYAGLTPSESSSGSRQQRGHITKTGNQVLRHVLVESAWHYLHPPAVKGALKLRQRGQPEAVTAIAWKTQTRLHRRYYRLVLGGKPKQVAIVSVARELLAFVWEIAQAVRAVPADSTLSTGTAA